MYNKIYNQISKQSIFIKIADVFCVLFTFISKYVNLVSDIIDDAKKYKSWNMRDGNNLNNLLVFQEM